MLACARIGAIHSVVFGGFAAPELATRIDDCQADRPSYRPPAASKPGRIVHYKPLLDGASDAGDAQAAGRRDAAAADGRGEHAGRS